MSKSALRKELALLTREQLIEVIIDAYEARKEVKEYFDFFINPDVDKLITKFREDLKREFRRTKWGLSKARISKIKANLKIIAGYKLDPKVNIDIMIDTLTIALVTERYYRIPESIERFMSTLTTEILNYSDRTLTIDYALMKLDTLFSSDGPLPRRVSILKDVVSSFGANK